LTKMNNTTPFHQVSFVSIPFVFHAVSV
jgi:hypothetical protein